MGELLNELYIIERNCEIRQECKIKHSLSEILFILIVGMICNCDTINSCQIFAEYHQEFFKKYLPLDNGIPSNDTIYRVMDLLDKDYLSKLLCKWKNDIANDIIAIDGKTVIGSKQGVSKYGKHIISAYSVLNDCSMAEIMVKNKSHELSAIPEILNMIHIKDKVITMDAMGTHNNIAESIVNKKGNYILPVKENQKLLYNDIKLYFDEYAENCISSKQIEKVHSNIETRTYYITDDVNWIPDKWNSIKAIGYVKYKRVESNEKTVTFNRYFICSKVFDINEFSNIVRKHWSVETLHLYLDCSFNEDKCSVSNTNAVENLNIVRKFVLKLLKQFRENHSTTIKKNISINSLRQIFSYKLDELFEKLF